MTIRVQFPAFYIHPGISSTFHHVADASKQEHHVADASKQEDIRKNKIRDAINAVDIILPQANISIQVHQTDPPQGLYGLVNSSKFIDSARYRRHTSPILALCPS